MGGRLCHPSTVPPGGAGHPCLGHGARDLRSTQRPLTAPGDAVHSSRVCPQALPSSFQQRLKRALGPVSSLPASPLLRTLLPLAKGWCGLGLCGCSWDTGERLSPRSAHGDSDSLGWSKARSQPASSFSGPVRWEKGPVFRLQPLCKACGPPAPAPSPTARPTRLSHRTASSSPDRPC